MSEDPKSEERPAENGIDDAGGRARARTHREAAEAAEEAFFADGREATPDDEIDDVDPELLRLPRPRRRRNPVIGLAVVVLSIYLMLYLRHELLFYLQSRDPVDVGEVAEALQHGRLRDNSYVTVRGAPDRKHSVILEGGKAFSAYDSFFRLQRSNSRVFVRHHRKRRTTEREVHYEHTGRVVRFSSLPLLRKLQDHFERTMTVAHDLDFDRVREARASGEKTGATVVDREGSKVKVRPDQLVWINVQRPDEWVVQFPRRSYEDVELARQQMRQRLAGLDPPFADDDEASRLFWRFVIVADEELATRVRRQFKDPVLDVGVVPRQVSYTAEWSAIDFDGDALVIRGTRDPTFPAHYERTSAAEGEQPRLRAVRPSPVRLERAEVLYITVSSKFVVPDDAVVIVTRDSPGDYWHYLLLYLLLASFVVFNTWTLISRLRAHARSTAG